MEINLAAALRLTRQPIAIVGAGGKSTALFALARAFGDALVTTTTHLGTWQSEMADHHWIEKNSKNEIVGDAAHPQLSHFLVFPPPPGVILVTGPATPEDRLPGVSAENLALLQRLAQTHARPLLIEADGSRQRPLKAPADHEPAIPPFVEAVIVVAGLSALGQPLTDEWVHRPEIFASLTGLPIGSPITPAAIQTLLTHPAGGLKNIPAAARRICLLTQADTPARQSAASAIASTLLADYNIVLAATGQTRGFAPTIVSRFQSIAGIILAAGAATRYGQPKQLLDWNGIPLVRHVAQIALAAGLSQVIVVTGANAEGVEAALKGLPVVIARCEGWEEGQAASIRVGVQMAGREARTPGGVMFLLADQPYITPTLLRALVERYAQTLAPIVAPLVDGRRGNPVLFDQSTFPELLALTGDVGGRALFSRYPVEWLPWLDAAVLLDVDTPDDYRKLLAG